MHLPCASRGLILGRGKTGLPSLSGKGKILDSGAKIAKLLQDIRASYWFLPTSMVLLSVLLALLTLYVDRHMDDMPFSLPETFSNTQVDGARSLMSIISQSAFGVAGVMFSMTMVAVSFASGNFGPRLIGNFMRDRGNQLSLGTLIATFVFALMVARAIQDPADAGGEDPIEAYVPHLSIMVSMGLMGVSVFTVIFFVHHIPETINVGNITAALGNKLVTAIKGLIEDREKDEDKEHDWPERDPDTIIYLGTSGYVQAFDKSLMTDISDENDLLIYVVAPPGDFVSEETPALHIWGGKPDEETSGKLRGCFAIGHSRTEDQNLLFLVDELVEMSARALSPGVNDPFTAINCLNWMFTACLTAANYRSGLREDRKGRVRTGSLTFLDLLEQGFGNSRPYTETDALCDAHVHKLLNRMQKDLENEEDRETLRQFHARLDSTPHKLRT